MFNSLIHNIAKPFQRSNSQTHNNSNAAPGIHGGRDDRVEDGFLLVGDTASERTIINARNFNADSVDAPPNYGEVSRNCLPSYQDYTSNMSAQSPTLDISQFSGIPHGNPFSTGSPTVAARSQNDQQQCSAQGFSDGRSGRSAISDVPFVLGNGLQFSSSVQEIRSSSVLQQKSFDYSIYDYNFNLERAILNEHDAYRENEGMEY